MRTALSLGLCCASLGVGIATVCLTARNRARAAALDERQRWCEAVMRQNALFVNRLEQREWRLLTGTEEAVDEVDDTLALELRLPEVEY